MIFRPSKAYKPTTNELYTDLAKEVGAWQRDHDRVPASLIALRDALRRRVNRASLGGPSRRV